MSNFEQHGFYQSRFDYEPFLSVKTRWFFNFRVCTTYFPLSFIIQDIQKCKFKLTQLK